MPNKTFTVGSVSSPVDINVTGTLTAPTPTSGSGNTQVATKGYVDTAISNAESPPEVFTVTLTLNVEYAPPRYIGDKTYSEIQAAITAGKLVQVRNGNLTYYYVGNDIINNTSLLFVSPLYVTPYTNIQAPALELFTLSSSNLWTSMGAIGQARITASGILKGDGSGNVSAATAGTDYAAASHNHGAGNITSGTLGVARGGTGATTFTSGALLKGNGTSAITTAVAGTDYAAATHGHSAADIVTSFQAGCVAVTGTLETNKLFPRPITHNTSTSGAISQSTNIPTMQTLRFAINRTTSVAAADTNYTTYMARGEALNSADTNPTVNGAISWTYA